MKAMLALCVILSVCAPLMAEESTDIEKAIDKASEKIAAAVEKIEPVAEEAVRQYSVREAYKAKCAAVASIVGGSLFAACIFFVVLCFIGYAKWKWNDDWAMPVGLIVGILGLLLLIITPLFLISFIEHSANARTPIIGLLERAK